MSNEYIQFDCADEGELTVKRSEQVPGVNSCGYDRRSASLYSIGDYIVASTDGNDPPGAMTLERIVGMRFVENPSGRKEQVSGETVAST